VPAGELALFAAGKIKPKFMEHGPLDISVYGDTAVVTGERSRLALGKLVGQYAHPAPKLQRPRPQIRRRDDMSGWAALRDSKRLLFQQSECA